MTIAFEVNGKFYVLLFLSLILFSSCAKDDSNDDSDADPIVGKWSLTTVNAIDVADVECYRDSFLESDGETITFFIQDRLQNGDCETVLSNTQDLTIENDFYFLGDEAIEIYIEGNTLSWRVDIETNLAFRK